jgi:ABC-2 type transport system ATP-binding protein
LAKDLDCDLTKKFKELSRGNKQKIGLISALMHKPELLILDEPTSGLDPLIQEQFNEIILAHKKAGKTTFISSHILSEVQELCDNVAFIKEGKLIANEPITNITKNSPFIIELSPNDPKLVDQLNNIPIISNISLKNNQITFSYNGPINKLLNLLSKYELSDIQIKKADLESIFMQYYKD